jgi:hypothetical protein
MRLASVDPTNERPLTHTNAPTDTNADSLRPIPPRLADCRRYNQLPDHFHRHPRKSSAALGTTSCRSRRSHRETGPQFIWGACCGTGPKPFFRPWHSETSTWVSSSKFSGNGAFLPAKAHVSRQKGAGAEAEWLLAVAVRIISHQGEEIFRVARSEAAQAAPHAPGVSSGVGGF